MELSTAQHSLLDKHLQLVIQANEQLNITRIDSLEEARLLHLEDSLMGIEEVTAAPQGLLADLGSGAGFPGIPLAAVTGRSTTLVESVGKKAAVLKGFTEKLGLDDAVEVYAGRVEALAKERRNRYSVVTARALSSLSSLMELASPLLQVGGQLICYKAADIEDELQAALALQEKLAMKLLQVRECLLSDGNTRRSIVVFKKTGEALVSLPRREGQAQRKPYRK